VGVICNPKEVKSSNFRPKGKPTYFTQDLKSVSTIFAGKIVTGFQILGFLTTDAQSSQKNLFVTLSLPLP